MDEAPKAKRSGDPRVCYVLYHEEGPVVYTIYSIDPKKVGGHDPHNLKRLQPNLVPLMELSSHDYPKGMGFFAVGSKIYFIGGEIAPRRRSNYYRTHTLTNRVYICDTSASLTMIPDKSRMNGGKYMPHVVHHHVTGMIYVLSMMPPPLTHFTRKNVFFESFDPIHSKWSPLPNPPFYNYETGCCYGIGTVTSHNVFGSLIVFYTSTKDFLFNFHIDECKWECVKMPESLWNSFPFLMEETDVSIPDYSVRVPIDGYPFFTHALVPELGFVEKKIEDLAMVLCHHPCLAYGEYYRLLDLKNGWFCLLKNGCDTEDVLRGNKSVLVTVFRLVTKRIDEVFLYEVYPWLPHKGFPSLQQSVSDFEKAVGETPVFGAKDVRCSLFNVNVKHCKGNFYFDGCFLLET